MESLPGQVEVLHGEKKLRRPLRLQLGNYIGSGDGCLLLGLVRTQAIKGDAYDLVAASNYAFVNAIRGVELWQNIEQNMPQINMCAGTAGLAVRKVATSVAVLSVTQTSKQTRE